LDRYSALVKIDGSTLRVTVQAGMRLRTFNKILAAHGLALSQLGQISEQSVAGKWFVFVFTAVCAAAYFGFFGCSQVRPKRVPTAQVWPSAHWPHSSLAFSWWWRAVR
jgi:hypothetical protein